MSRHDEIMLYDVEVGLRRSLDYLRTLERSDGVLRAQAHRRLDRELRQCLVAVREAKHQADMEAARQQQQP